MPRPIWSGAISFGLVTIPVKLYNAVSKKAVSFNQLNASTNHRIKYRKVDAVSGDEVPDDQIVKGYELAKDRYVLVDPDELEPFLPAPTRSIDLEEFVDPAQIDPVLFDSPYYLVPDKLPKPYLLLLEAMERTGKVGIGTFVMRNRQYVAAVRAANGHLLLNTLVHADEVVDTKSLGELDDLDGVEITDKERAMAEMLVSSLEASFSPERFPDTYRQQVLDLIQRKAAGEELEVVAAPPSAPKVIDLMAALEASVAAAKEARGRHPSGGAEATKAAKVAKAEHAPAPRKSRKAEAVADESAEADEVVAPKRRTRKSA